MNRTMTMLIILVTTGALLAALPVPLGAEQKGNVKSIELPYMPVDLANGPDQDMVSRYCGICHGVEYIPMQPKLSKAQWGATVTKMIKVFGAPVPQEDTDKIVGYLSTAYGTGQ
jgi:sulfite dehydrogenase (cytochrome) subunit B